VEDATNAMGGVNMPIIRVTARGWRTIDQKRQFAKAINDAVKKYYGGGEVDLIFEDITDENMSLEGKLISDIPEAKGRPFSVEDLNPRDRQG
jgi:phenylpyruvate tautomerase PptA (4-oxalocrotonate tautomerase family)